MEIKHLHTFLTATKTLNFTQTAKILDYAQSSITAQIKSLEEELGMPLFERLGKRIYLTEAGNQLKQYAQKMLDLDQEMRQVLAGQNESNVVLTIGAQESQCSYRLPVILQSFKQRHPQVRLIFKPVHTKDIAKDLLQSGTLDLAFITDTFKEMPTLHKEMLIEEDLVFIASPWHHLAKKNPVTAEEIGQETILLTEKGCSYRTQFEHRIQFEGVHPEHIIEFASIEAIKQCVMAGLGISLLPKMAVEKELDRGSIIEIPTSIDLESVFTEIAWHKDKYIPSYLEDFIQISRDQYKVFNEKTSNKK
ncbi:LysR family transcriptional regulator [Cytobacillus dafuensis]|uniref:LysR family transcriptional regulator n=1 Tax=Cytobacillus dafuensis TaxID=1742359 RepID=A0A5B8YZJ2_CYTDA|nr:LysR family transcriptional regulator [Cytobacillus dafuensis]QED46100.1 LysR family transcriptional regulator [Cytobacillus dafuensis]